MVISKKSIMTQAFRGSNIFQGGGSNFFQGGGGFQVLFFIETHITCDFAGEGVRNPYPPSGSAHDCLKMRTSMQQIQN